MANIELKGTGIEIRFFDSGGNEVAIPSEKIATLATSIFDGIESNFLNQLSLDGRLYKSQNTDVDQKVLKNFNSEIFSKAPPTATPIQEVLPETVNPVAEESESVDSEMPVFTKRFPWVPGVFQSVVGFMQRKEWLKPDSYVPGKLHTEELSESPTLPTSPHTERLSRTTSMSFDVEPDEHTEKWIEEMEELSKSFIKQSQKRNKATTRESITAEEIERLTKELEEEIDFSSLETAPPPRKKHSEGEYTNQKLLTDIADVFQ
ncbi:MAG: hypothetical protein ChlgKO_09890 [Chlamydiales bacterium]